MCHAFVQMLFRPTVFFQQHYVLLRGSRISLHFVICKLQIKIKDSSKPFMTHLEQMLICLMSSLRFIRCKTMNIVKFWIQMFLKTICFNLCKSEFVTNTPNLLQGKGKMQIWYILLTTQFWDFQRIFLPKFARTDETQHFVLAKTLVDSSRNGCCKNGCDSCKEVRSLTW